MVASLPAFAAVRDPVLPIQGGPLVSLTAAMNALAGMTGSASGGVVIALDALVETYMRLAVEHGINPELLHRVSTLGSGTLDSLPHNGTVLTVLRVSKLTHRESYFDTLNDGRRRRDSRAGRSRRSGFRVRLVLTTEQHPVRVTHRESS